MNWFKKIVGRSSGWSSRVTLEPITCPNDLISLLSRKGRFDGWAFRGQPKAFKRLVSSFDRHLPDKARMSIETVLDVEQRLIRDFVKRLKACPLPSGARLPAYPDVDRIGCLRVMQHYGVPTRLLDWTTDPWIAAYFACCSQPEHPGELIGYDRGRLWQHFEESCKHRRLDYKGNLEPIVFGTSVENLLFDVCVRDTPRIRRQKGLHTIATEPRVDHGRLLYQCMKSAAEASEALEVMDLMIRVEINAECKSALLEYLRRHQKITAATMFPDFDGLAQHLRRQIRDEIAQLCRS